MLCCLKERSNDAVIEKKEDKRYFVINERNCENRNKYTKKINMNKNIEI